MTEHTCACGRKSCDDQQPLCLVCACFNRKPSHVETPLACGDCRVKLAALPRDIADAYTYLGLLLPPRRGKQGSGQPRRAEAPTPLSIDPLDLTSDNLPPRGPIRLGRLAENLTDQIGHLPVAAQLHLWVRDWCEVRDLGEQGVTSVSAMADWLSVRTDWACDHHHGVDDYAGEMTALWGTLQGMVGRVTPDERPQRLPGVPCVRCRHVTLVRHHDDRVECLWPDCRSVWNVDEYTRITRAASNAIRRTEKETAA